MNGWYGPVGRGAIGLRDPARPRKTLPPFASPSKLKSSTMLHNRRSERYCGAQIGVQEGVFANLPPADENRPAEAPLSEPGFTETMAKEWLEQWTAIDSFLLLPLVRNGIFFLFLPSIS